jgi:methionyl-tRNA synthetase
VLFVCGTDEHGTPAELAALEAGLPVAAYCARQHTAQAEIYRRFGISFDHFGRSSSPANHALTRHLFLRLEAEGFIEERVLQQVWSPADRRFLPDRYIVGTCPHCGDAAARGDQCDSCGRLLDPVELIAPRSALSGSAALETRGTRHLFLLQSKLADRLRLWLEGSTTGSRWCCRWHAVCWTRACGTAASRATWHGACRCRSPAGRARYSTSGSTRRSRILR